MPLSFFPRYQEGIDVDRPSYIWVGRRKRKMSWLKNLGLGLGLGLIFVTILILP
jgi:hypothetical protein